MPDQLARIERYYDTVPRDNALTESIGPFTLFVSTGGFPFYARPTLGGAASFTVDDVLTVVERQKALGVPVAFEWVDEVTPGLHGVVTEAGLTVGRHPLLALGEPMWPEYPMSIRFRTLKSSDRALPELRSVLNVGFSHPGTEAGAVGVAERDAGIDSDDPGLAILRSKIRRHVLVTVVAEDDNGIVGGGSHNPRNGVTELAGIATLPTHRRRGIAAMVTAHLVADAFEGGVELCFLSAETEAVARIYEKVGFVGVATACIAEPG